MTALNLVFAGTPEFGLPCLDALAASPHRICAIYTQPDRPAGRGRQCKPSAVKQWAEAKAIPVYQPVNFKQEPAIEQLAALKPDLMIVIAYGLLLPQTVLNIPRFGCINVHASLLPRWRGASPIQHAILHGDQQSGITIMQMDRGLDTGDSLAKAAYILDAKETAASLHDHLAQLAPTALLQTINVLAQGRTVATPQDHTKATYAGKINKSDAQINWHNEAIVIDRQIRAFNPWPIAFTQRGDSLMRIYQAQPEPSQGKDKSPGTVLAIDKQGLLIATGKGNLRVQKLQFAGGKVISVTDWMNAGNTQSWLNSVLQ